MSPEQRIAQLEAELLRERSEKERLLAIVEAFTSKKRSAAAERQARYRARQKEDGHNVVTSRVTSPVTRDSDAPPSPLVPPSLSPAPSLSSPLNPPFPPVLTGSAAVTDGKQMLPVASAEEQPKPRRGSVPNAVGEWFEAAKARRLAKVPATAPDNSALKPGQWARLGEALKLHGQKSMGLALDVFFDDRYASERHFPLGLFVGQWEKYFSEAEARLARNSTAPPAEDEKARLRRETWERLQREKAAKQGEPK